MDFANRADIIIDGIGSIVEGGKFKPMNFPDPFSYGDKYKPIFPPRHRTMKAVLDNLPDTVSKVYVFGSALRLDSAVNSDIDLFFVGSISSEELSKIHRAIPEGEKADILIEPEDEFYSNIHGDYSSLYRRVFEGGYKIYERKDK